MIWESDGPFFTGSRTNLDHHGSKIMDGVADFGDKGVGSDLLCALCVPLRPLRLFVFF